MSTRKRRKAAKRRRQRTIVLISALTVLALAIGAVVVWLVADRSPWGVGQRYPMEYSDLIRMYAGDNDLEPAYVAAVILAESSYDPHAVSSSNAQGLMQLLPSTAEWIAGKFDETYTEGDLFDPDVNLRYGCWYLGFLMKRYNGDKRLSSAAYHAGQGTVDKWLQTPEYAPDGRTLTTIPFKTTDTYVQRVLKYYEKYVELYKTAGDTAAFAADASIGVLCRE